MNYPGDEVFDRIEVLCEQGESYLERGKLLSALQKFQKAYDLLPEPSNIYPSGTWLLTAMGDINFMLQKYERAAANLSKALSSVEGEGNAFIHFRLGQCLYKLNKLVKAKEELSKAFQLEGKEIFDDEDPQYLQFFQS